MEQLPQSKGKGAVMFARCRQRIDEIAAEHEELRHKGIPMEAFLEPESDISLKSLSQKDVSSVQQNTQVKHNETYHQTQHQLFQQPRAGINGLGSCPDSSASKPLVTNRTAEPFLIGLNRSPTQFSAVKGDSSPTMKKYKNIFKVPVPVNTTPQVWSPTGDIIASRDERIAVPAIKTVVLPEMKRRGTNKTSLKEAPEEDYFSLGAEACNFMQTPTIRQKHPPPILPKPTINPHCPPWSAEDDATHSPLTPSKIPVLQENWVPLQPQPDTRRWAPSSTQAIQLYHMSDHLPAKPSASSKIACLSQPQQPLTTTSPSQSKPSWTKPHVETSSVVSCPAQRSSSYVRPSKIPSVSSISEIGSSQGPILKGKGAELFARRQSRMEKFIVDAETVQANIARASSPTQSMPSTWKYSSNVRAPPPVSYDPTVSPFYPLAAQKQSLPLTTSNIKPKGNTEKPKTAPKHLSVMEIMKHQPYKLDSALFTYAANAEAKGSSPKVSPVPPRESIKTQVCSPTYLHNISQVPSTGSFQTYQQGAVTKPSGPVSLPYPFTLQSTPGETRPPAQAALMKMPAVCMMRHGPMSKAFSSQSTHAMRTGSNAVLCTSSFPLNSEIISRCNLPIAPKPKFSARKGSAGGKQWKPVVPVLH